MVKIVDWPASLPILGDTLPELVDQATVTTPSVTGTSVSVDSLSARWVYSLTVLLATRETQLAFRAFLFALRGPANVVRLPICDCGYDMISTASAGIQLAASDAAPVVPYSDETSHSDGTYFANPEIDGAVSGTVASGATSLRMLLPDGVKPWPGQLFSVNSELHGISEVVDLGSGTYEVAFTPRMRRSTPSNAAIALRKPVLLARLDGEPLNVAREDMRLSTVTLSFSEYVLS